MEKLLDTVLDKAREAGAAYPTIGEASSGEAMIVDTDSGRVWAIEIKLRELKD